MAEPDLKAPSFLLTAGESLTPLELAKLAAAAPSLMQQTRGNAEPIIVLPGMSADDTSTLIMRKYLNWLGYNVQGWGLGRNVGDVRDLVRRVSDLVSRTRDKTKSKVSLVGWSLGGIIAREVARDHPEFIRQIITMGSPIVGGPKYTRFGKFIEARGANLEAIEARIAARERRPISVPITSIYSKRDGIVSWQASIDNLNAHANHIEVNTTHLGLGISPEVFKTLAKQLAVKSAI